MGKGRENGGKMWENYEKIMENHGTSCKMMENHGNHRNYGKMVESVEKIWKKHGKLWEK